MSIERDLLAATRLRSLVRDDQPRDLLIEAGRIVKKDTMLLATSAHLDAVVQLVREAKRIIAYETGVEARESTDPDPVLAWLQSAEKVLHREGKAR